MSGNVTLNAIQVFCCVYEDRSYTVTGRRLNKTKQAIIYQIKELRQVLGDSLFDYSDDTLIPTVVAQRVYPFFQKAVINITQGINEVERFKVHSSNASEFEYQVGAESFFMETVSMRLFDSIRAFNKGYHVKFKNVDKELLSEMLKKLMQGGLNCLVYHDADLDDSLMRRRIFSDDWVLIHSDSDLDNVTYLSTGNVEADNAFANEFSQIPQVESFSSFSHVTAILETGSYATIVPRKFSVYKQLAERFHVSDAEWMPTFNLYLFWTQSQDNNPYVRWLIDCVNSECARL